MNAAGGGRQIDVDGYVDAVDCTVITTGNVLCLSERARSLRRMVAAREACSSRYLDYDCGWCDRLSGML